MKRFLPVVVLLVPLFAAAKDLGCSVKAKRLDADTRAMAKVNESAARKSALDKVNVAGATISSGGLEIEDGCLLYTYDVKVPGRGGVEEVIIDAGTGKVLAVEHESAAKEAAEKAADKVSGKKKAP
jgi:uncharacterized membrane protein YkoI